MEYCMICGKPLNENLYCNDPECFKERTDKVNKNHTEILTQLKEENDKLFINTVTNIIKFNFPKIQNLNVTLDNITFDATEDYTKEEVEQFVNSFKNATRT